MKSCLSIALLSLAAAGCGGAPSRHPIASACAPGPRGTVTEFSISATALPWSLAVGGDDNIWFTDRSHGAIGKLDLSSGTVTELPTANQNVGAATEIARGPDGSLWFTVWNALGRMTTAGIASEIPVPIDGSNPWSIALGTDGNLWFTELSANRVARMAPATGTVTEFPVPTARNDLVGVAATADGSIWAAEADQAKVLRLGPDHRLTEIAVQGTPQGMVAGSDGNLWIAERRYIGRLSLSGALTELSLPDQDVTIRDAEQIAEGPDGSFWYTDHVNSRVGRIDASGAITEYTLPGNQGPQGIVLGPDDNLWFAEAFVGKIGCITP